MFLLSPQAKGTSEVKDIVLFVGRIIPVKNIESIIKVAKPEIGTEFWIIGPVDDKKYFEKINKMIKEGKINNVKFLGPKNRDELLSYYSTAKAYIHTSHAEGLPQAVL